MDQSDNTPGAYIARGWRRWGALAASVLTGVLIGLTIAGTDLGDDEFIAQRGDALVARGALEVALTEKVSGSETTGVAPGFSYRTRDGEYCRTFATGGGDPLAGIACRSSKHWVVEAVSSESESADSGYVLASTALPAYLRERIEADIDGDPLDAVAEATAIARNWR
jgi:hypothetical protein